MWMETAPRARAVSGVTLALAVAVTAASCSSSDAGRAPPADGTTLFEGARLIVGDGRPPLDDAAFVVRDGRFVQVGRRGEVDVPPGAARVDLGGRTVMPALINTHVHLASSREELVDQLRHNAYYGVGAVLSLGLDEGEVPFQLRDEVVAGAARYRTAGRGITTPEPGRSEVPYWVTSEEEAREAVRELGALDVDMVKIWVDDRSGRYEKLPPELYTPIIAEAHAHGLRVAAHIFTLEDAKGLLQAGVDVFAHGIRDRDIDDELVSLIRERPHVVLMPNLPEPGVARDLSWLSGTVPPEALARMQAASTERPAAQASFAIQARNLERLSREGMRIALGTDGSSPWAPHQEMADMVRAGMSPADVIVASTRNAAQLLGLDDAGMLEAGRSADFVVLDADPLEDITHTRRIAAVYLRGEAVDRDGLSARFAGGSP